MVKAPGKIQDNVIAQISQKLQFALVIATVNAKIFPSWQVTKLYIMSNGSIFICFVFLHLDLKELSIT